MMSKNNSQEILRQASDNCCCYALRKLSVGVASVLISTTIYVGLVHADTVATSNKPVPIAQTMAPTTAQSVSDNVVTSSDMVQSQLSRSSVNDVSNEAQSSNSQQAVNIAQNDNTSTYNQDKQTSSFDVNNNGVNNVAVYSDNKVSQQSVSNQAENAQLDLYNWNIAGQAYDDPSKINNGNPLPWGRVIYFSLRGSFDLTEAQLKSTQLINVGTLKCSQSPVNIYPDTFRFYINHFALKTSDGATVGEYLMTPEHLAVRLNGTYKGTGSQHFVISDVGGEDGYLASTRKFRGYGAVPTTVTYQVGTHVYHVKVAAPGAPDLVTQDGVPEQVAHGWSYGESKLDYDIQFVWDSASRLNNSQLQEWVKSGGMSIGSMSYPDSDKPFEYAFKLSGDDTITPGWVHIEKRVNALDSQDRMHNDHGAYFANAYGGQVSNPLDDEYVIDNAGDGLSLNQLKQMKPNNVSGAVIYWSRQSDGSALVYVKMPASDMKIKNFDTLRSALNDSPMINLDSDPDKAIENTINYYKNRNVMGGYPFSTNWVLRCMRSDDTKDTRTSVTYYDPETGKVLNQNPVMAIWKANKTSVKGQSTVKLHVISSAGVALQQVKSFTDWPDQNKHAFLTIPSITGYHLVTNPQSVLSALHLSGTAISASTQVSYPAENTIADYYVVMAPDTETVKVNIVDMDANSMLATYTLSGLYGSTIQSTSALSTHLQAFLASGKYDLVSNPLTSLPKYSTTNNPITISLKHHLDSTQRHYRVIEDLPDGTKKVIIDVEATLYKDVNEKYYSEWGANLNGTGKILKSNEYRILSGQSMSSLSNNSNVVSTVDMIPGYTVTFVDPISMYQDGVHAVLMDDGRARVDVFNGSGAQNDPASGSCAIDPLSSRDFHITYTRRSYPVTVNYYDLSGALISSSKSQHLFADSVDVAPSIPTNYVLAPGQSTHFTVSYDTNELDLVVIPRVTISTDSRTITRTIQIVRPDRSISTVVQHVIFSRPAYKDAVSGAITYGLWTTPSQNFIVYQPETIDGYHIDTVKSQAVLPMDKDSIVQVAYTKLATSLTYPYIDAAGHSHNVLPAGYHVVLGQNTKLQSTSALIAKDVVIKPADDVQYVTRTVTITLLNNRTRTIRQRVRKGTRFGRVAVPKLRGYKVVVTGDSQELGPTAAEKDIAMSVQFVEM